MARGGIQLLNAIGSLILVFAYRCGKAIIVASLSGAPLITVLISMAVLGVVPPPLKLVGIVVALVASVLLVIELDTVDETPLPDRT